MSYRAEYYNDIFLAMRHEFGEQWYAAVPGEQWNIWRSRIKKMFDQNIMIREIKLALVEAAGKRKWPAGTSFFSRVEDVVLKNRREVRNHPVTYAVSEMKPLSSIINKHSI